MGPKKRVDNEIINYYEHPDMGEFLMKYKNPNKDIHDINVPFYAVVCAPSGAGKTNFLVNLISKFDNTFNNIYILNQQEEELYQFLNKKISKNLVITQKFSDLPSFEELEKDKKNLKLIVFDDMIMTKNQDYIITAFKRFRKLGCCVLYLSQSYFQTPIFIRKNVHYLFLLAIDGKRDLNMILRDFNDIEPDKLYTIYKDATKKPLNFFRINVRSRDINKKYSHNFNSYYKVEDNGSDSE